MNFLDVLQNHITINGNTCTVDIQTNEDVWNDIKRCFSAYRAVWVGGKSQSFKFPISPKGFIEHVIKTQAMPKINKHSYHPTVCSQAHNNLFEHTCANPWMWTHYDRPIRILEPSAGEGR